jgi:hypothetical protein
MAFKVKPTVKQREVLVKLAEGYNLMTCEHSRSLTRSAFLTLPDRSGAHITARADYADKFSDWGWIECISDPGYSWRGSEYKITDLGREALTLGVRK